MMIYDGDVDYGRIYFLPMGKSCAADCLCCQALGQNGADESGNENYRNQDFGRSLLKAKSGQYKAAMLSYGEFNFKQFSKYVELVLAEKLQPMLQVHASALDDLVKQLESTDLAAKTVLVLSTESLTSDQIKNIQDQAWKFKDVIIRFVITNKNSTKLSMAMLSRITPSLMSRVSLVAPIKINLNDKFMHATEVNAFLKKLYGEYAGLMKNKLSGLDIYNPQMPGDAELESLAKPIALTQEHQGQPLFSVVIPSYNNKAYLVCTVRHLLKQDLAPNLYEIIIVDDGSDDDTLSELNDFLKSTHQSFIGNMLAQKWACVRYVYYERKQARKMGDHQFRAGVARNLGVKHARGKYVAFLDSDIIVPESFLSDLRDKHADHDVIQAKRLHLRKEICSKQTNIEDINLHRDIISVERGYWDVFYELKNWDALEDKWKYVCTYALSLPVEVFKQVGWFRKNYCVYGYEDTDLGYRLAKAGYKFYLNKINTFHLYHSDERSEYKNVFLKKLSLLQHSAKVFYANSLDYCVYKHLEWVLQHNLPIFLRLSARYQKIEDAAMLVPGLNFLLKRCGAYVTPMALKKILWFMAWPLFEVYGFLQYQYSKRRVPANRYTD